MVWLVVWIVLMMFWLFFGHYSSYDPAKGIQLIGGVIIPWLCVLILGLIQFGAIKVGPI